MSTQCLYVHNYKQWQNVINNTFANDKPIKVREIEDGFILPTKKSKTYTNIWDGGICDKNKKFVTGLMRGNNLSQRYHFGVLSSYDFDSPEIVDNSTVIFGGVFIGLFGHFILEGLSRLWYVLENSNNDYKIVFITINGYKKYYEEFLKLLGISLERIVILDKITQFKKIIVPEESVHSFGTYHKEFKVPYSVLRKNCFVENNNYTKVYLTKTKCETGIRYVGEEYFENFYRKKGFLVISPEMLSIKEQINVIANAKEVVTTLGTISHLAMFAKPSTKFTILTRVNNDTLYPQQLVNDCFDIDYTYVDVSMNYLYANRSTGVVLLGITKYWKDYVKDKYNEEITESTSVDVINQYFKSWLEFFSQPNRIHLVEKDGVRGFFKSLSRIVFDKEIELPKEKTQVSLIEKEKYEIVKLENDLLRYKYYLLENNFESFSSLKKRVFLKYKVHQAYLGWSSYIIENESIESDKVVDQQIESIMIETLNSSIPILYSTYFDNSWSKFVSNGEISGTTGKGLPIYGLKIFIDSKDYSVFYRVLKDNHEYSNWFNDGEECLSENKIFGIQLRLVRKIVF